MSEPQIRRRYNVGVQKIAFADRDVAHAVITDDDPRGYLDLIGSDAPDDDEVFPVGVDTTYSVELTDDEVEQFRAASNCRYIEPDGQTHTTAGAVLTPAASSMSFMRADFPRADQFHGRDVLIAILDAGTTQVVRDYLGVTMVARQVFSTDSPGADEITAEHGCLVAACCLPRGGKFLDVIVTNNNGTGSVSGAVAGARWAADNGAKVINYSSGATTDDTAWHDMMQYLLDRGVQFFSTTGNDGANTTYYPGGLSASYANAHCAIAFDEQTGQRASFSNYVRTASGCAPGVNVLGFLPDGRLGTWNGTSAAAPHMALLCAMGATAGRFTAAQVGAALKAHCRDTGQPAAEQGGGAYDLNAALTALGAFNSLPAQTTRRNLASNPSGEAAATGFALRSTRTGITANPVNRSSTIATPCGTVYLSINVTGDGTAGGATPDVEANLPTMPVTAGQTYTWSALSRCSIFGPTVQWAVQWQNDAGTNLGTFVGATSSLYSTVWARYLMTLTAPAGATKAVPWLRGFNFTNTTTNSWRIDGLLYEQGSAIGPYFDGASAGAFWDGTAHLSTSTLGVAPSSGADYHPVAIIWSDDSPWPTAGEYDFMENGQPGNTTAEAYLHYPHPSTVPVQQEHAIKAGVDLSQWHNFAIEWTPTGITGYLDGVQWWHYANGAISGTRSNIQAMPSGHLTLQLDNFHGSSGNVPATMEIDWVRVYNLTPSGPVTGPQTISPVGISSTERIGAASVSVLLQAPPGTVPTRLGQSTNTTTAGGTVLPFTLTWTAISGTPTPPGNVVISGAGGIARTDSVGAPVLSVADGPQTIAAKAIEATDGYGAPTVEGDRDLPPAPGGVLVPALYAVGLDGHTLTPLPNWTKMTLSPVRSAPGAISVEYPAGAPGFDALHDGVSASPLKALEIRVWLGGSASASLGGWLTQKSGDDLTAGSSWTFAGSFHEWLLTKALIGPQTISETNKSGALIFAAANAGLILTTIVKQAQARGALPLVTMDFSSTKDSNGQPWVSSISSLKLSPQTTAAQVADKLVELGMAEYEITAARVLRAYNPGGRGVDRTLGASPLTFAYGVNMRERARRETSKDAGTAVLVTGSEGFYSWASSPTAQSQLGWRAEVPIDAGQLDSQSAVDGVAQSHLLVASHGAAEYNAAISFAPGNPLPLIDYAVGDWGYTRVGPDLKRLRIVQIQVEFAVGAAPKGTVVQNDLITDKLSQLYRRLNAISTGDAIVGTSTPSAGGPATDYNPPAAPTGLTLASTIAYQVPGQTVTLAEIGAGWTAVTNNAYPDNDIAGKAAASVYMAARMASDLEFFEDWTWVGMPSIVDQYHEAMLDEWDASPRNPHGDNNTLGPAAQAWLNDYPTSHLGGGAITDDIAEYQVQFQYLGAQQVTTPGPRGEAPPDQLTPEGSWESPVNSPTRNTTITFGNVEGGRAVGVRVRAVDTTGNVGPWSIVVAIDSAADDQPPPSPSRPIAAAWFRTMNITWDGKGSSGEDMILAAPDILSGGGIEIHVAQGIDFLPDRPLGPTGKVDLSLSQTYRATLYDAGTYNVADLTIGQTYFARFVAVDRNGNASEPSDTSDPVAPQQLVNIDIGPDAISRLQIIDGEIVRAKIADLAVNSAKIEELEVGKLTAGTMTAQVIVGGRFSTPATNTNHLEFDSAGIRLYRGNTVVGRWQVADASMLVTGTYLSALNGKRINILPTGTIIMYPPAGSNYGFIENLDGDLRMSGQINTDQRAGYLTIDETRAALTFSSIASYNNPVTRFQVDPIAAASWAPIVSARVDRRRGDPDGLGPRWYYLNFDSRGEIGSTVVHMQQVAAASNHTVMYGANSDAGIVFDAGFIGVVHNSISPAPIHASSFNVVSGRTAKVNIADIDLPGGALAAVRKARSRKWRYRTEVEGRSATPGTKLRRTRLHPNGKPILDARGQETYDLVDGEWTAPAPPARHRFGPLADELPVEMRLHHPRTGELMVSLTDLIGVLWEAVRELDGRVDDLDARKSDKPVKPRHAREEPDV